MPSITQRNNLHPGKYRLFSGLLLCWAPLLYLVSRISDPILAGYLQWGLLLLALGYRFELPSPENSFAPLLLQGTINPLTPAGILSFFERNATGCILLLAFLAASLRIPPWTWSQPDSFGIGEDWTTYRNAALQVAKGDFFLLHQGPYFREMTSQLNTLYIGILYLLFNTLDRPIYFVNHLMAAGIFIGWYKLLNPLENRPLKYALLLAALLLLALDLLHYYSMRLLSENLTLPMLALLFYLLLRNKHLFWQGLLCGLLYLNRLELGGTGVLLLVLFAYDCIILKGRPLKDLVRFAIPFVLIAALYPLRGYFLHDQFRLLPDFNIEDGRVYSQYSMKASLKGSALHIPNLLWHFIHQLNPLSKEDSSWRSGIAWYAIHGLFFLTLLFVIVKKRFTFKHVVALGFIASITLPYFFGPITYGFRHSLPMAFAEISLVFFLLAENGHSLFTKQRG